MSWCNSSSIHLCYRSPRGRTNRQSIAPGSSHYVLLKLPGIRLPLSTNSTSLCPPRSSGPSFPNMTLWYCQQSSHLQSTIFSLVHSSSYSDEYCGLLLSPTHTYLVFYLGQPFYTLFV